MNRTTKATLITGASQGLGRALALELGRRGTPLLLVARSRAALDDVVAAVRAGGGIAHGVAADIGDKHAIHAIAAEAAALIGPIDVLIHNASTLGPTPLPLLLDTECEDFERVLQVNLLGPFRLTKLIAGSMALRGAAAGSADRDRPTVAFISSDAAVEAYPRWGSYGVSKAAADHLARIWAAELAELGVRFLAIDPGEMNTAMHAAAIPDADPQSLADPASVARRIADLLQQPPASGSAGAQVRFTASELAARVAATEVQS